MPPSRLTALARYAAVAWAPTIARMPSDRRIATLVAFAHVFEATAQDDALDVLDQLIAQLLARVERLGDRQRLRTLRDLDEAARLRRDATLVLLDPQYRHLEVRPTVFPTPTTLVLFLGQGRAGATAWLRRDKAERRRHAMAAARAPSLANLPRAFVAVVPQSMHAPTGPSVGRCRGRPPPA